MPLKFRQIQHLDKGTPLVVTVHHRNGETTENKGILQYCLNDRFSIANEIKKRSPFVLEFYLLDGQGWRIQRN